MRLRGSILSGHWVYVLLVFLVMTTGLLPLGADDTNAAPVAPEDQTFGQFIVAHQDELAPYFSNHSAEFFKDAIPLVVSLFSRVLALTFVACWALDVLLSRGFSTLFAPAYARIKRAFVYSTGQLIIGVFFSIVLSLVLIYAQGVPYSEVVVPSVAIILFLSAVVVQIGWVCYLYRTTPTVSSVFYLVVMIVHFVTGTIIAAPMLGGRASGLMTAFVDQKITPVLQIDLNATKQDLAAAVAARDKAKAEADAAQKALADNRDQQADLIKQIEAKKNSDAYLYSQIAKVHAAGDLTAAHDQYTAFLVKFPSGAFTDAAKAQLQQVDAEVVAKEAKRLQDNADAAAQAAAARAEILGRAAQGQVTLSEMRKALLGKSPAEVKDLFGVPDDTASDKWGYKKKMILDPIRNQKFGLTVVFSLGEVQSVNYYYGGSQ